LGIGWANPVGISSIEGGVYEFLGGNTFLINLSVTKFRGSGFLYWRRGLLK